MIGTWINQRHYYIVIDLCCKQKKKVFIELNNETHTIPDLLHMLPDEPSSFQQPRPPAQIDTQVSQL